MNTRIIPHAVSLVLLFSVARAEDVIVEPVITPDPVIEITLDVPDVKPEVSVCSEMPEPEVCFPEIGEEVTPVVTIEEVVPEVIVCPGVEETIDGGAIKVCELTPEMMQRGGEEVVAVNDGEGSPLIAYSSGGVMNFGGPGAGGAGLEQGLSGSGLGAVTALKFDAAEPAVAKREVKVIASAVDIVIGD